MYTIRLNHSLDRKFLTCPIVSANSLEFLKFSYTKQNGLETSKKTKNRALSHITVDSYQK